MFLLSFGYLVYFSFFKKQESEIFIQANKDKTTFLFYNLLMNDMGSSVEDLEEETENLNILAWEEVPWKKIISQDYRKEDEVTPDVSVDMETNMDLYSDTVGEYAHWKKRLRLLTPVFQNGLDYLDTRESIFQAIPRGRPLKPGVGVVTSTYGIRIDPFGILNTGEFHTGIDFAAAEGTPIYASAPGIVVETEWSNYGLGRSVRINHENGFYTLYGHCSQILVRPGQMVRRGERIALVGATGKATGAHVHYEVRIGLDSPLDPEEFINLD